MTELMERPTVNSNGGGQLATVDRSDRPLARHNPAVGNRGIELHTFEDAWRMAVAISKSGMAPRSMETAEALFVAIQMGLEVGLSPMASIRSIAVVNGRPAIYGDAALALVRSSGLLETIEEWTDGSGELRAAHCKTKRRGMPAARETVFSMADARKAKLLGKSGPWTDYPERMLMWRARGYNLRDEYGDVLQGLYTVEEAQDIDANPVARMAAEAPTHESRTQSLLSKISNRPLSEGQTFEPSEEAMAEAAQQSTAPQAPAAAQDTPTPGESTPVAGGQPAPGRAVEPDVSGADAEPAGIPEDEQEQIAYMEWVQACEGCADKNGVQRPALASAINSVIASKGLQETPWKFTNPDRNRFLASIATRSGLFAGKKKTAAGV